jgi:zona occludens toxin (predicted ATPase)
MNLAERTLAYLYSFLRPSSCLRYRSNESRTFGLEAKFMKAVHANGKMKRRVYEKELRKLQVGLCRLQD